ncbi:hypothetical protein OG232_04400 [Streptomyces sp. NBC_01411]|uniref:hypothetical protein n=1 Tax=Streptomyces sp. NBC_01411 TaxID=2903857 RepID=UPI0032564D0F
MVLVAFDIPAMANVLSDAVNRANIAGRVDIRDGAAGPTLELTLLTGNRMPFSLDLAKARAWLAEGPGIEADATHDAADNLVITPRSEGAVHHLIARLIAPHILAESVGQQLRDALTHHQLSAYVEIRRSDLIQVEIRDGNELAQAVRLSALLGADKIADKLKLGRPKGIHKLADRMAWLLIGALGPGVRVKAHIGCGCACEDGEDAVHVGLSVAQASLLVERIRAVPSADRAEDALAAEAAE